MPPRAQAAANSRPVLKRQRSRYASTVVSGRRACSLWSASPREGEREEVVARRASQGLAVPRPDGRVAPAKRRGVEHVVVHERRHVHELGRARGDLELGPVACVRRCRDEHEQGPKALAARGQRLARGAPHRVVGELRGQALLDGSQERQCARAGECAHVLRHEGHVTTSPTCSATMPLASRR
jgi:hypothetical protein